MSRASFICPVKKKFFFDPVVTVGCGCECYVERSASTTLTICPNCKKENPRFQEVSHFFKQTLAEMIAQQNLYDKVHFDLNDFAGALRDHGVKSPMIEKYVELLMYAKDCLNVKGMLLSQANTRKMSSAIELLALTSEGRDLLRKHLKKESGKYFFGKQENTAEIVSDSLHIQVNGKSIREWLDMTTAMEVILTEEQNTRQRMILNRNAFYRHQRTQFLFLPRGAQDAVPSIPRLSSDAVNVILEDVLYDNKGSVKEALDKMASDPAQLSEILLNTGTARDYYRGYIVTNRTLLHAAAAVGDIEMCQMLKLYFDLIPNGQQEFEMQLAELFPNGIEAHNTVQRQNAFKLDSLLAIIRAASPADLLTALNKQNNNSLLCHALEDFRCKFTDISRSDTFNPYHISNAYKMLREFCEQCECDGSDPDGKKRWLFWLQVIGYMLCLVPARLARVFSERSLIELLKIDPDIFGIDAGYTGMMGSAALNFFVGPSMETCRNELLEESDSIDACFRYTPAPSIVDASSRTGLGFDFVNSIVLGVHCTINNEAGKAVLNRIIGHDKKRMGKFIGTEAFCFDRFIQTNTIALHHMMPVREPLPSRRSQCRVM